MKVGCWLALSLLSLSGVVWAEGACPLGSYPVGGQGAVGCAPIPGYGASENEGREAPPPSPIGRWRTTWGAIALAESTGDVGVTVGKDSESEAKREAMTRCAEHGAKDCELDFAYENQCAVIAWAWENGQGVGGAAIAQGGPSIEVATQLALPACSKMRNGGECKIVYSDCTKPVFEKF